MSVNWENRPITREMNKPDYAKHRSQKSLAPVRLYRLVFEVMTV